MVYMRKTMKEERLNSLAVVNGIFILKKLYYKDIIKHFAKKQSRKNVQIFYCINFYICFIVYNAFLYILIIHNTFLYILIIHNN